MKNQCVVKHIDENGKTNYKVWGESLAKEWNLNIVFRGTYDECINKQKELSNEK